MDVPWVVEIKPTHGVAGSAALLTCAPTSSVKTHIVVTRWFKDGVGLAPMATDAGGQYVVGGSRGDILVIRDARPDDTSSYSCEAQHILTGDKRRSPPAMLAVSHATGSMAPRMISVSEDETVPQGGDIRLVCCAIGSPPPTYSWFRHANGRLSPVSNSIRISVSDQVLVIRRALLSDGGVWTCRAHNQYGEQRRDARLRVRSRLVVSVHPQLQVANSGSSVTFNCSVEGGEARVRWLHDGVPVGGGERVLRVHGVVRAHRGMYQCFAERDLDSAQAAAELRLGDTAPELHYTFIEQALHPGPSLTLHCSASGSPPPRFTWLLDMQPIEEHNTPQRSVTQFMNPNGDVVSYLNITSVRPEDGGRYTCRAHNSRGVVEHSTRLNVYGYILDIRWQRGGVDVSTTGGRALSSLGGELLLWPAEPADAGIYSCRVTAPSGQYAQKDVQIFVRNPPKIAGFSFPADLVEGSSIQVLCGITSGDKPVYFSWLKDGQHIPSNLQVQEKSLDEFSFLIFSHVTSKHSGEYTCVASNNAAEVNHTARLAVKVAPSWMYEPQDVSALLGTQIIAQCSTKGYPEPQIAWLKGQGAGGTDFRPLSRLELPMTVLSNGSLTAAAAARVHEGRYMCRADNGVGRGLSKVITISVNEPAHFEFSSRNMSVRRTAAVALSCEARGDPPIQLHWTHNMQRLDLSTYRISVSEKRSDSGASSTLSIAHAQRRDSGVYRCRAENAYGRDELLIYLAVQEFPEAPRGLSVTRRESRGARLSWRRGYDGNARLRAYRLQYRVVGAEPRTAQRADWTDAPTRELPPDLLIQRKESLDPDSEVILEYQVDGLRPATAYALRLAAVNDIGDSEYSESVIVQTLEEEPSEPPRNIEIQADAPGELLVKWQAPPQESWNGELLGYAVWWRGSNATRALTVAGWTSVRARLGLLRPHARYEVRVRAYNSVGASPPSAPLAAATLEDVPEAPPQYVRCEPLSSQSLRVWWEPPPAAERGGLVIGYEITYQAISSDGMLESIPETRRTGGSETVISALRAGNYSLLVRARTAPGAGPPAHAHCATLDDVPGPPADIKALANTESSVIVSWLSPIQKNGKIRHYTVYNRPQRTGQHSHITVLHMEGEEEYQVEVRGLQEHQLYEFWVTAATTAGEGEMSAIIVRKPSSRAPLKLWSFPRRITAMEGRRVVLSCGAAGAAGAAPRVWTRRHPPPPTSDTRLIIDSYRLIIPSYSLEHARGALEAWHVTWVAGTVRAHVLRRLACGAAYRVRIAAHGPAGSSPQSAELDVSTSGGSPKPALDKHLFTTNSSCIRLNLLTWDSNGCPINQFVISVKSFDDTSWRTQTVELEPHPLRICDLHSATWYHLRIVAISTAGTTTATYYFSTLTENGERIQQPEQFPPGGEGVSIGGSSGLAMLLTAAALLAAFVLLAALAYKRSITHPCFRKGYEQSGITEEEEKSVEKRDNRRNCQQVYTSSPIKHPSSKKEQQEMYEISPYATFSMAGGASDAGSGSGACGVGDVGVAGEGGATLRTFGRAEPAPLSAAPPHRTHCHRDPHHPDDYGLSRAMTLTVRRSESDSDSSGSPCAECGAAAYRRPLVPAKEEAFRAVTDSSAESAVDARSLAPRRRPRRHHTPTTRYQQRQEQERRDFTIHV
ncbi:unnamed protein product [Parnassius apollo]|uniref:Hemolin n=1 Tax=Parnassius apollo TaxID=110799 RepID=A0A8S3XAK2_PARAO|nr:unnamed protein product [Parnassius apollo]